MSSMVDTKSNKKKILLKIDTRKKLREKKAYLLPGPRRPKLSKETN